MEMEVDDGQAGGEEEGFSWESRYAQSWEALREDASGTLQTGTLFAKGAAYAAQESEYLRRRRAAADAALRRSIMRHLVVLIDWSVAAASNEVAPNRAVWMARCCLKPFLRDFFEQNPLSQVALVALRDGLAERIGESELLSANLPEHEAALEQLASAVEPQGQISLQNGLEVATSILAHVPGHGSREVLLLQIGLSSLDPGSIFAINSTLTSNKIRVAVAALSGEVAIIKKIAKQTGGTYAVALDDAHFVEIVREQITPPTAISSVSGGSVSTSYLVRMGFPPRHSLAQPVLCACHGVLITPRVGATAISTTAFKCPQCHAILCQLPMDCAICKLTLISAPHLAKSYHHLFPVSHFDDLQQQTDEPVCCNGCDSPIDVSSNREGEGPWSAGRCRRCRCTYCASCAQFIHEDLYNCPGCS